MISGMDLPLPPADSKFIGPARESNFVRHRFTLAEMRYNCRLTEARAIGDKELAVQGTPVRDGFKKIFEILS